MGVMKMRITRTVIVEVIVVAPRVLVVGVRCVSHTVDYKSGM